MEDKDKKLLVAGLLLGGGIFLYTKSKNGGTGFKPLDNMINPNLDNPTTTVTDTSANGGQTVSVTGSVKFGDKGNAVITLQRYLKEIKGESLPLSTRSNGTLDGDFGNEVKTLVTKYNIPYPVPLSKIAEFETALKAQSSLNSGDSSGGYYNPNAITSTSTSGFNAAQIGNEIHQAISGFGTDEERLRKAYLRIKTASQFEEVSKYYKDKYLPYFAKFDTMDEVINDDLNDSAMEWNQYKEFKISLGITSSNSSKSNQVAPNGSDNGGFFYNEDMWATQGSWGSTNGLNGLGMIDWYNVITKKDVTIYQKGMATSYAKPNTNLGVMIGYSPDKQYVEVIDIQGNQFAVLTSSVGLSAV
ncbi:hypothetical protein ACE193_15205 [Bernardetia sp. OM2101]|uniref:hypothetical protein n=1 Tax=Bernardetia sp. OM2101 TaxID=3344876 RepID=UPI0035D0ADF5